ncbi:MAG: ATP-binding protein [Kofleriaceae bacterium]
MRRCPPEEAAAHRWHARAHHRHLRASLRHRRGLWRVFQRLRWRVFLVFGMSLGIGVLVGRWVSSLGAGRGWTALAVFGFLWMVSGAFAWKITARFLAIVQTARRIGDGDLSARVRPGPGAADLQVLAEAINDMAERIGKQLADQKQLLAAVSHELRTPLGHLRILLDGARERGADPALVDELEREVLDLDALVGRLLASSRLDFVELEPRRLDVAALARDVVARAGVDDACVTVTGEPWVTADPTLMRRALGNLVENATVHGGGVVAVRITGDAGFVRIEVDDAGPGVPAARRGEVFEPFVPSAAGGLGLGMALVARIAKAHGGRAWLDDRPDGGGARAGVEVRRVPLPPDPR